jgi:hypothetical protein
MKIPQRKKDSAKNPQLRKHQDVQARLQCAMTPVPERAAACGTGHAAARGHTNGVAITAELEGEASSQLNLALRVELRVGHLTEVGIVDVALRVSELRRVGDVERVTVQLKNIPFG